MPETLQCRRVGVEIFFSRARMGVSLELPNLSSQLLVFSSVVRSGTPQGSDFTATFSFVPSPALPSPLSSESIISFSVLPPLSQRLLSNCLSWVLSGQPSGSDYPLWNVSPCFAVIVEFRYLAYHLRRLSSEDCQSDFVLKGTLYSINVTILLRMSVCRIRALIIEACCNWKHK